MTESRCEHPDYVRVHEPVEDQEYCLVCMDDDALVDYMIYAIYYSEETQNSWHRSILMAQLIPIYAEIRYRRIDVAKRVIAKIASYAS